MAVVKIWLSRKNTEMQMKLSIVVKYTQCDSEGQLTKLLLNTCVGHLDYLDKLVQ